MDGWEAVGDRRPLLKPPLSWSGRMQRWQLPSWAQYAQTDSLSEESHRVQSSSMRLQHQRRDDDDFVPVLVQCRIGPNVNHPNGDTHEVTNRLSLDQRRVHYRIVVRYSADDWRGGGTPQVTYRSNVVPSIEADESLPYRLHPRSQSQMEPSFIHASHTRRRRYDVFSSLLEPSRRVVRDANRL